MNESKVKFDLASTQVHFPVNSSQLQLQQPIDEPAILNALNEVPNIKFRDVVLAKKFGSSPYDSDR